MEPLEYLRILRRRKLFVALAVLVGVLAGWISAPGEKDDVLPEYRASHTLILNPEIPPKSFNLDQAALRVTTGAIPQNVAAKLGGGADPVALTRRTTVRPDVALGTINITVTDTDPAFAVAAADTFAQALVDDLGLDGLSRWQQEHDSLQATVNDLQAQIDALQGSFDPTVSSPARSQFEALTSQFQTASSQVLQLNAEGPPPPPFTTLQSARAFPVSTAGLKPPDSKPARALLLGGIGLLLGIGLAFAAERLETRLTTKRSAETALGLPVVAEIPNLPKAAQRKDELLTATRPAAPFVEAYRGLRTMVLLRALDQDHADGSASPSNRGGKVLIVASPGAGEGKTTTTAHLAALLAEAGNSVLVISADFRRPRVHELFGVPYAPGLSEVLAPHNPVPLRSLNLATPVKGVKLLPSGSPVDNPAPLLGATVELMRGSRSLFDFILVDTAPLLLANDASELIQAADMVLLITRAHRTSIDACERSAELLQRIDAPVIGAVLVGASDMPSSYRYYRYRAYGASGPPTLSDRLRGRARADAPTPAPPAPVRETGPSKGASAAPPDADPVPVATRRSEDEPVRRRRGTRGEHRAKRGKGLPAAERPVDRPPASPPPPPPTEPDRQAGVRNGATNGSNDPDLTNEALAEFWQEFKERR